MPDKKTKTRKEVIGGKEFEFACEDCENCLGVSYNDDGSMDLLDSETGQRMNGLSRYTVTRFIAMMNEKTKK